MENNNAAMRKFAARLRMLREEAGWSQAELAERIGCSKGLISFYENCKREAGFTAILRLSEVFGERPAFIMGDSDVRRIKKIAK